MKNRNRPSQRLRQISAIMLLGCGVNWAAAAVTGSTTPALQLAADQSDPVVQTALAVRYEHGEGVPRDLDKAYVIYCNAARQGHAQAQFNLGWLFANGRGVPRNDGLAAALFAMAAEQGHAQAAKVLPYFHEQPELQLPACLRPDLPLAAADEDTAPVAEEDTAPVVADHSPPLEDPAGVPPQIKQLVYDLAPRYGVDPKLALAVISAESAFKPNAVSPKNAQGLMQLIPETARRFGVKRVFNPVDNINGGLAYLRWLLAFFKGDVALVLAAYNAGERAVEKYRGIPPYSETRLYVRKITGMYTKARHAYAPEIVEPSLIMAAVTRARH